jgi:MFS family permease
MTGQTGEPNSGVAGKLPGSLTGNRDFLLFILSRLANVMGNQIVTVAVGWHVYLMTGDPLDLGLVGLSQFAPALALFLVAGLAADRFNRRSILVLCNGFHVVAAGLLLAYTMADRQAVWPIFAILLLHGSARSFYFTASQAIMPNLVAPAVFPKAVAWSSSVNKAAQLAGPAAGGVLIAVVGDWVYLAALAMFAVAGVTAALIAVKLVVRPREPFGCWAGSTSSGARRSCWGRSRSTCWRCCLAASWGCCRSSPKISCMWEPRGWG